MARTLSIGDYREPKCGRLIDAGQIVEMIGGDPPVTEGWVCRNVPGKIDLGHRTKRWDEDEVLKWIATLREPE